MAELCGACGTLARSSKNRERDLRGRACPRYGRVHHGCCALAECSRIDARGAVQCDFTRWSRARDVTRNAAAAASRRNA